MPSLRLLIIQTDLQKLQSVGNSLVLRRPWLVQGVVWLLARYPGLAQPVIQWLNAPLTD